jgi:hypothetical protein
MTCFRMAGALEADREGGGAPPAGAGGVRASPAETALQAFYDGNGLIVGPVSEAGERAALRLLRRACEDASAARGCPSAKFETRPGLPRLLRSLTAPRGPGAAAQAEAELRRWVAREARASAEGIVAELDAGSDAGMRAAAATVGFVQVTECAALARFLGALGPAEAPSAAHFAGPPSRLS